MNIEKIIENTLSKRVIKIKKYKQLLKYLEKQKNIYLNSKNYKHANNIWKLQQVVRITYLYIESFDFLKYKKYYNAWVRLEQIENILFFLRKNFSLINSWNQLDFIEKIIYNFRVLFPYRMFVSSEYIVKSAKCSICNKKISLRSFCGHQRGKVYKGELCVRIIDDMEFVGVSIVERPLDKTCVAFLCDEYGNIIDHYNYYFIDYVMAHLDNPFENWELKVRDKIVKSSIFYDLQDNDLCPCGSRKYFNECCKGKENILIQDISPVLPYKKEISKPINGIFANTHELKIENLGGEMKVLSPRVYTDVFHDDLLKKIDLSSIKNKSIYENHF